MFGKGVDCADTDELVASKADENHEVRDDEADVLAAALKNVLEESVSLGVSVHTDSGEVGWSRPEECIGNNSQNRA